MECSDTGNNMTVNFENTELHKNMLHEAHTSFMSYDSIL